jgi:hypothetical protein
LSRSIAEWVWRLTMLAAVLWVGWEVVQLREDLADLAVPGDEATDIAGAAALVFGQPISLLALQRPPRSDGPANAALCGRLGGGLA